MLRHPARADSRIRQDFRPDNRSDQAARRATSTRDPARAGSSRCRDARFRSVRVRVLLLQDPGTSLLNFRAVRCWRSLIASEAVSGEIPEAASCGLMWRGMLAAFAIRCTSGRRHVGRSVDLRPVAARADFRFGHHGMPRAPGARAPSVASWLAVSLATRCRARWPRSVSA